MRLGRFYLMGPSKKWGPIRVRPTVAGCMMAADKGDNDAKKMLTQARKAKNVQLAAGRNTKWREDDAQSLVWRLDSAATAYRSYWRGGRLVIFTEPGSKLLDRPSWTPTPVFFAPQELTGSCLK